MKPNFALGLTDDGITLWQRDTTGWLRVGAVAPDAADMDVQMQGLAKIASALAPEGVRTKLVVPDEQILFCDLPVAARNREMQGHEIRAQLAGRTPYLVEELDFDWTVTDGMAHVAVVARETLVEAEDFARSFDLNPVSSVAAPVNGGFPQEPFFGPTRGAREIVGDLSLLERDQDVLRETGIANLPEPELVKTPEPELQADLAEAADEASKPEAKPEPESVPEAPKETAPKAETKATSEPDAPVEKKAKSRKKRKTTADDTSTDAGNGDDTDEDDLEAGTDATESATADKPDAKATDKPEPAPEPVIPAPAAPSPVVPATSVPEGARFGQAAADQRKSALLAKLRAAKAASETRTPAAGPLAEGMSALDRARQKLTDVLPSKQSPVKATAAPEPSADAPAENPVSFRSRRAAPTVPDAPAAKAEEAKPASNLLGGLRAKLAGAQNLSKSKLGGLTKVLGAATVEKPASTTQPTTTEPTTTQSTTTLATSKKATSIASAPVPAEKPAADKGKARSTPDAKSPYPIKMSPAAGLTERKDPLETLQARAGGKSAVPATEAERLTIFGARGQIDTTRAVPQRALLILAGIGLILVAAAIWVAYFLNTGPVAPEIAEQAEPPAASAPLETSQAEPEAVFPESMDDIEAALGLEDAAQQLPLDAPEPAPVEEAAQQPDASLDAAPVAEIEQPTGRVAGVRSSALLAPQDHLPLPEAPLPPAPFGADPLPPTRSEVEQAILALEATPDQATAPTPEADTETGLALPEGEAELEIDVTEGTPAVVPPTRPEGLAPETEAATASEPSDEAAEAAETAETADAAEAELTTELADTPEAEIAPDAAPETLAAPDSALDPLDESTLEIVVTEGRPAVVPPARPAGLTPEPPAPEPAAVDIDSEALAPPTNDEPAPDPSADQAELDTPPPGGVALTALRPAARPAAVTDLAEAARAAETGPEIEGTALAVAASARPSARPSQFAAVVQRALRAAQPRSTTQTPAAVAAAPAPAAQAPVQTARAAVPAAPPIPSSASVAREATQARAINLRQINLIGVMGTSSSRRALVRLSNGRVVTVRVGDSLDNGSVTAISENELRYSRRGRDVVLRIAS
ncbi:MAG: hypothetical protein JJU07_03355 [Natronohydrobacter sp.]|nr:hypothetical protein [Natronohydrobacter sp.]